ncbi:MAG: hypothetical protein A2W72_24980 [Burkholderiales bacterium RIFCSPLOWO2_12_67_14]|nr:MAG: hypothetical protein A3I64_06310 [Burkholderiales bacterium RIFCSPLOWO2_02_FULL_67_64]OGB44467.1 MAG: hypothetical protein A3E51_20645 [Burkholderiales bacterium RIFCSPHIGHO2_12_FULL_67_38]OGB50515.1 MAG: hypothetical protein A2W72_24980 [Burkholderiales bacterium RIFCSPLOWO2_12_67_14]OGB78693.1 MAG: hypothetical protein A3G82_12660 [Burkholderiales bacterium RIFCSPLOWO2_12_FULL_67_210]
MTAEKKRCALECASLQEAAGQAPFQGAWGEERAPCALLDPQAIAAPAPPHPDAPRTGPARPECPKEEDESADPVGDGHSDADHAARTPPRPDKEAGSG